jgi:hypothetical protein
VIPDNWEHNNHIDTYGKRHLGWQYRSIRKYYKILDEELPCDICKESLKQVCNYLKLHTAIYPGTNVLCTDIMNNYLTREGQELYAARDLQHAKRYDYDLCQKEGVDYGGERATHPLFRHTVISRNYPALNCFPLFEIEKESKMFLTDLDPPEQGIVEEFRYLFRNFLEKYKRARLPIPSGEVAYKQGSNLYRDRDTTRVDDERPNYPSGPFLYQSFLTGPLTKREVWLPNKSYKSNSSWWHFFTEPIVEKVPFIVGNEDGKAVRNSLHARWKPCTSIDLKGFGMQFPREYLICAAEEVVRLYPSPESEEELRIMKLVTNFQIEMPDGTFKTTKRGVGLGYYANLMTLCIGAIVGKYHIPKMFSDDMLVSSDQYEQARNDLIHFNFVINEEKSGERWRKCAYFAGQIMAAKGVIRFSEAQSGIAAAMTKRFHFERKQSLRSIHVSDNIKLCFHYEKIFGSEFFLGESLKHPKSGGFCTGVTPEVGWSKWYSIYEMDQRREEVVLSKPWLDKPRYSERASAYHKRRQSVKFTQDFDSRVNEYMNDEVTFVLDAPTRVDPAMDWSRRLPMWADWNGTWYDRITCGRATGGLDPSEYFRLAMKYPLARDAKEARDRGGYTRPPWKRDEIIASEKLVDLWMLRESSLGERNYAYRLISVEAETPEEVLEDKTSSNRELIKRLLAPKAETDVNIHTDEVTVYESDGGEDLDMIDLPEDIDNLDTLEYDYSSDNSSPVTAGDDEW